LLVVACAACAPAPRAAAPVVERVAIVLAERGEQGLHLRRKVQRVVVPRVEERLDPEAVAHRHHPAPRLIPQDNRELAA